MITDDHRRGERVIINDSMNSIRRRWSGTIVQCAYFPPSSPGAITMTRYRIVDNDSVNFSGYVWVDSSEVETDKMYYRDEKLNDLGL